jgi:hypothetical protein
VVTLPPHGIGVGVGVGLGVEEAAPVVKVKEVFALIEAVKVPLVTGMSAPRCMFAEALV